MHKIFLFFCLALLVNACNDQDDTQKKTALRDSIMAANKKDTMIRDSTVKTYEGVYIFNLNVNSFRDCSHPDSVYWVIDETEKLADMYKNTIPVINVYGSVYARVRGELTLTEETKLMDTYPKTLHVKEVISVEKKTPANSCMPNDLWASGNKPGWSLQISPKENLIELYFPVENEAYYSFYSEPQVSEDTAVYTSFNQVQRYVIEVKVWKENCSDAVSGKTYEYTVEAIVRGRKQYTGCLIKGVPEGLLLNAER